MKRGFITLAVLFCWHLLSYGQGGAPTEKPNIIFICTDDQALWTMGCSGNAQAYTPNMDRLAKEGAYFQNAFSTTPVCSPARASILTGQYASEHKIYDFIAQPGHILYKPDFPVGLPESAVTFAGVLKDNGYMTGLIGKWHLGDWSSKEDRQFHPTNFGFKYFMGLTGGGCAAKDPLLEKDGVIQKFDGFSSDILTKDALSYINSYKNGPFLLCLDYRAPHSPWLPVSEEDAAPYDTIDPVIPNPDYPDLDVDMVKKKMKQYLASVSEVDRNLGRVLLELEKLGISNNTIVIFTSDHGYNMGHNGIEHKGNGIWITKSNHPATKNIAKNSRPNMYDHSLKVPVLIRWPGKIRPGTVIGNTISHLDWFPTIADLANAKIPDNKIIRGRSILPLLEGKRVKGWNNDFYGEYSMRQYSVADMRCYRASGWKLIKDFKDPARDELYNLETDPEETTNLNKSDDPLAKKSKSKLEKQILLNMKIIEHK